MVFNDIPIQEAELNIKIYVAMTGWLSLKKMVMNYNTYNHIDIEWEKKQWKLYIIFGFFQSFDFERTWWRLFWAYLMKVISRTKFAIYVFILIEITLHYIYKL